MRDDERLLHLIERFMFVRQEFDFWESELNRYGYNHDDTIALAEYYGQMIAIAGIAKELYDYSGLCDMVANIPDPKFYPDDYNE